MGTSATAGSLPPVTTTSFSQGNFVNTINLLTSNVNYSVRTAPLTSKVAFYIFIQQI